MVSGTRAPRADAHRNRERLLEAAKTAFAENDKVSLESIARAAGVGIGTLYRHFPTREDLIEAVYRAERRRLCEAADDLVSGPDPAAALRTWMDRFGEYISAKREMADALRAVIASGAITATEARAELSTAVQKLLDAGAARGVLRADVPASDVVATLLGIFLACGAPDQREQADRMMDLLMDGLRTRR